MNIIQSTFLNLIGALNLTEIQEELDTYLTYHPAQTNHIAACQLALQVANVGLSDEVTDIFTTHLTAGLEFTGIENGRYIFSQPALYA